MSDTRAAEPLLASTLYASIVNDQGKVIPVDQLKTGCAIIDEALGGGLRYGRGAVCCVSGDRGSEGVGGITRGLLISHLLSQSHNSSSIYHDDDDDDDSTATIIDTSNSFDLRTLDTTLISRLSDPSTRLQPGRTVQDVAKRCLDRVSLSRVFDVEGMLESVAEMRERLEMARRRGDMDTTAGLKKDEGEGGDGIRGTVADSQDEGEDMLDDELPAASIRAVSPPDEDEQARNRGPRRHLLVIDNLAQVFGPPMRDNYVQGQALLTSFLRSLAHTARQHNICVVVVNWTISYKDNREGVSAFASLGARPGLGKTLDYMVDVHLLVNNFPHGLQDDKTYRARQSGAAGRMQVMEVLQDREDNRLGRVALFNVDSKGMLKSAL